jgi:hypothetical protein
LTNALGNIIAVLQEYIFAKREDTNEPFCYKLYKTKEGNWYDITAEKTTENNALLRALKLAVDAKENNIILK